MVKRRVGISCKIFYDKGESGFARTRASIMGSWNNGSISDDDDESESSSCDTDEDDVEEEVRSLFNFFF